MSEIPAKYRNTKTIDGVTFTRTHSGQRKAYGDSFDDFEIESKLPAADVERICSTKIQAAISEAQYRAEYKANGSASNYLRPSYTFKSRGIEKYFYSVCFPYND